MKKILIALMLITGIMAVDKAPVTVEYGGVKTTFASLEDMHLWEAIVAGNAAGVEKQLKDENETDFRRTSTSVILTTGQTTENLLAPSFVTCIRYGDAVALRMFKALDNHGLGRYLGYPEVNPHIQEFVKEGSQRLKPKGPIACPKSIKFIEEMWKSSEGKGPRY